MKNFKLLLATTAILSAGLAVVAIADGDTPAEPTGTGYARIEARAIFTSPIRLTYSRPIDFGILDPKKGGEVTIEAKFDNPQISDTNGAIIASGVTNYSQEAGSITLTGGWLSYNMSDIEGAIADNLTFDYDEDDPRASAWNGKSIAGSFIQLALTGESIPLTETETSYGVTPDSSKTCGSVKNLTQGMPRVNGTGADRELQIPLGGTLEINQDYNPSGNYGTCTGHTTVTYVLNAAF